LRDAATVRGLALNPDLAVGEAYMAGGLEPVDCSIYEVLDVLMTNLVAETSRQEMLDLRAAIGRMKRRLAQFNPTWRARRNVAHHYDLNGRLYSLFLDRDRQYSCGYFPRGDETLEEAQAAKKRHIAAKLLLNRCWISAAAGAAWR
jgi:cyclopropane-fatty-acyl-phospholipid synthase